MPADEAGHALIAHGAIESTPDVALPFDGMPLDPYMADGGRYRRRRHGCFSLGQQGEIRRLPPRAHYQSREYNVLNGGVQRWFAPLPDSVADGALLRATLRLGAALFASLSSAPTTWDVEVHQFRIEAGPGQAGLPTPEGVHRDGVDYVIVLLARRQNIASGTTTIHAPDGTPLGSFTLREPGDMMLIDDRRVFHGVTPVQAIDRAQPAHRDVLVVTFRRVR